MNDHDLNVWIGLKGKAPVHDGKRPGLYQKFVLAAFNECFLDPSAYRTGQYTLVHYSPSWPIQFE